MTAKRHPKPKQQPPPKGSASGSGTLHPARHPQRKLNPGGGSAGSGKQNPAPKRHHKRSAAGLIKVGGDWITGFNQEAPTCVPAAIANSLMAVTGLGVTDDEVLELFERAGGDRHGVSVAECIAALATHGIGGHRPHGACCVSLGELNLGDIIGLAGSHTACYTTDGLVSWGDILTEYLAGDVEEVWRITWTA